MGLGKPTLAIDRSIANIFHSKKFFKIYGRSYLINLIIGTQIGAKFTRESCKFCFKTINGKIFPDVFEKLPQTS